MRRNWLEWAVLGVSVAALLGVIGFLAVDGITDRGRPPEPVVSLDRSAAHDGPNGWLVPAVIRNEGDEAAEAVLLRAQATVGGEAEQAEVAVDYLPSGSEVEVTFGFSSEPEGEVRVRVIGFRLP